MSSIPKHPMKQAETVEEWKEHFAVALRKSSEDITVFRGELSVQIELDQLISVLTRLKDESGGGFTQLSDITAVDYPERGKRFDLIYQLLSVTLNQRIRLIVPIAENEVAPSVTALFGSANWAEREIWDMFGIFFNDHGDLRRLLTDYGFEGHPLR
ncbi:MAG: complex I 30 kDa subunit family protein, partial [Candidatus Puniceispirillales bacterium]